MANLLDFVPSTATTLVIPAGTNDLTFSTTHATFDSLFRPVSSPEDIPQCLLDALLLDVISRGHPAIKRLYVSLVLPRSTNRRRYNNNASFIRKFNLKAHQFNTL
ncbi:hypothetical protein HPB48_000061 [Haemaphysalis longicornis]|uniref:Uncharacterized protein n=1 Tax=Haemaphysalis longicornis TaxID=44386 RepID=A0A9J6FWN8_HAELO|nr:hypothetical protein HPB48_000061 [Haemaphysalis longicornis]